MFRRPLLALLLALALAAAAACGSPPTAGEGYIEGDLPDCPIDALDDAEGPVTLPLWYGGLGGSAEAAMVTMAETFNAAQDEVVVQATNQGTAYEEILRQYESTAASSTDQLPGVVYLEDTTLAQMVNQGYVLPAQVCMEAAGYDIEQIEPIARSYFSVDDVLWPGYMNISTPVLYYNKTHWENAGLDAEDPPETLDEVREQAIALKEAGVSERPLVVYLRYWEFVSWLNPVGVEMVNHDDGRDEPATEATFDTDESLELMEFLRDMNEEGLLNAFPYTEGSIDHYLALLPPGEQSSMLIETSTASTTIRDVFGGDITVDDAGDAGIDIDESQIDLAPVDPGSGPFPGIDEPGQAQIGGGAFYMLNTTSDEVQAAAWKFIEFMLDPENAKIWHFEGGYVPIVSAVLDEPDVQAFAQDDLAGRLLKPGIEQVQSMDAANPGPLIGPFQSFDTAVQRLLEGVLLTGSDPAGALSTAESDVTEALERYEGL